MHSTALRGRATMCVAAMLAIVTACATASSPRGIALDLYTAAWHRDIAAGEALGSADVYNVVESTLPVDYELATCDPDVGSGERCSFTPRGCEGGGAATFTMHISTEPNAPEQVTAASVQGVFISPNDQNLGNVVVVLPCGLVGHFQDELTPAFLSEIYSTQLVPWPFLEAPSAPGDTVIAKSRLAVNRGAADEAVTLLRHALGLGEDTTVVVVTAAAEAGAVMHLGLESASNLSLRTRPGLRFVWYHGADAYPTDTILLRRGVVLLDFAQSLPRPQIRWDDVLSFGVQGRGLIDTRTPSIATLDEMSGIAHYRLGRADLERARRDSSCESYAAARSALTTAAANLDRTLHIVLANPSDHRLADSASTLAEEAGEAVQRLCHAP